jgi:hypothetical protein
MAELSLAGSWLVSAVDNHACKTQSFTKFTKDFANALTLETTTKHGIKLLTSSRDLDDPSALLSKVMRRHKAISGGLFTRQSLSLSSSKPQEDLPCISGLLL